MRPRTFRDLGCFVQSAVLNLCFSDADLRRLGHWDADGNPAGYSAPLWSRISLHRRCVHAEGIAERLGEDLDRRFVGEVFAVRLSPLEELSGLVHGLAGAGPGLAGLLWACLTDPRPDAQRLGVRLCHECICFSCTRFVASEDAA